MPLPQPSTQTSPDPGGDLPGTPSVAPLTNVALTVAALDRAHRRARGLPGIVVLHGPSGWGKSTAAAYAASQTRAYYVQMQSLWTRRSFLEAVAREMGLALTANLPHLAGQIAEQLVLSGRPLIIDEADVLAEREGGAGVIKDLYESTLGTILLIGEEKLPHKLTRYERLHGRVLDWVGAQPASIADARALVRIYAPGLELADDLLQELVARAKGSVRRIAVNLDRVRVEGKNLGWRQVDLALWGDRVLYTGEPPTRRL
jgi:DNA transposition AAA+ family ATPase